MTTIIVGLHDESFKVSRRVQFLLVFGEETWLIHQGIKKMHALVAFLIIFDYIHARTEKA
jgi:hypothetical protein